MQEALDEHRNRCEIDAQLHDAERSKLVNEVSAIKQRFLIDKIALGKLR